VLDPPTGRFTELVATTELLHGTTPGVNLPLEPLRQRAAHRLREAAP
jgi:hypothetical protein